MSTPTGQIYDLKPDEAVPPSPPPPPEPVVIATLPRPIPASDTRLLHKFARSLTWIMVAIFLLGGADWAFRAGIDVRRQVWQYTRMIRFKDDIGRGFNFGNDVLRFAESQAHLDQKSDALAHQSPWILTRAGLPQAAENPSPFFRRLSAIELAHGIVAYIDNIVATGGDYDLDYPPLRLAIMTLWVRHVQRVHPEMDGFPTARVEDTSLAQDEDVAEPLLQLNAYCDAAAAIGMFLLVWLWVHRSFKPARPFILERWWRKRRGLPKIPASNVPGTPGSAWTVPHGILAFFAATSAFWYAYVTLVHFPPRPPPVVSVVQIQPGDAAATVVAGINSQNQDTTWRVDFGPTPAYGRTTGTQSADTSTSDQQLAVKLEPLAKGQTVHFRIVAASPGGSISSEDFSFVNAGNPINVNSDPTGGIDWPSWSVWIRLLLLFIIMVVSAQLLPPIHRGWACGAVAAMLVWLDPMNLIDSHAWPQWDVWILPVFITAALLASLDCWVLAGMLLGIGIMLKGQLLLGGPILILWPFFEGRYGALWRITAGFLLGVEIVTWPWIVNSSAGFRWIEGVMIAASLILIVSLARNNFAGAARQWIVNPLLGASKSLDFQTESTPVTAILLATALVAALIVATALVLHGVAARNSELPRGTLGIFLLILLVPPFLLRRKKLPYWLAGVFALSVAISAIAFGGSFSWATLGFAYGSIKHDLIQMSARTYSNLTSVLAQSYQWDIHDTMGTLRLSFRTPGPWRVGNLAIPSVDWAWSMDLDVKTSLAALYGICLLISSAAAALHHRRNDRRFLVALVVPWIVFPVVMCQMGGRYPVWACALSAAMVAVSLELSLLHVVLAVVSFAMVAHQLLGFEQTRWPQMWDLTTPWFPGMGWLMVLVAAIFFVAALVPSRKCLGE